MTWLIVAVVVVVLILIVAFALSRRRKQERTGELRERFGPEYDRTVEREGKRGKAEDDLERRADERDKFEIRELDPAARDRFAHRWDESQHLFVDDPAAAIQQADGLVHEVMRERGYPADDFERNADDLSVDQPHLVEHYRGAHGVAGRARREDVSTEDQRQAMVHFRGLFDELLGTSRSSAHGAAERGAVPADAGRGEQDREGVRREAPIAERDPGVDPERPDPGQGHGDEPRGTQLPR